MYTIRYTLDKHMHATKKKYNQLLGDLSLRLNVA